MTDLDTALRDLRALALQHGWPQIEVAVRADGRITLVAYNANGYPLRDLRADLDPDSAHPLPSAAVARAWREGGR